MKLKLETISIQELQAQWPASDEGRLCARLLQRYGFTVMVETALGAECTAERAQAESGANKAIAKMVSDFGTLGSEPSKIVPKKPMQRLHRFQSSEQQPNPEP